MPHKEARLAMLRHLSSPSCFCVARPSLTYSVLCRTCAESDDADSADSDSEPVSDDHSAPEAPALDSQDSSQVSLSFSAPLFSSLSRFAHRMRESAHSVVGVLSLPSNVCLLFCPGL